MFVLFTLNNEEVAESDEKRVYRVDADQADEDYLSELASDFAEEENYLYGIEAGIDNDGIEVVGYTCGWEILENITEAEILEEYGEILEV